MTEEETKTVRRILQAVRDEVLTTTYTILTNEYGISAKRVARAMLEVVTNLSDLDTDAINAITEEEDVRS